MKWIEMKSWPQRILQVRGWLSLLKFGLGHLIEDPILSRNPDLPDAAELQGQQDIIWPKFNRPLLGHK